MKKRTAVTSAENNFSSDFDFGNDCWRLECRSRGVSLTGPSTSAVEVSDSDFRKEALCRGIIVRVGK